MSSDTSSPMSSTIIGPDIEKSFANLKASSRALRHLSTEIKNRVLSNLAQRLDSDHPTLLDCNRQDLQALPDSTPSSYRDRLTLDPKRLLGMSESLRQVANLGDPVGEEVERQKLTNGLLLRRVRAPLGVIFMIFESRPNVALEAFSLAFKAGNAIALRGGSESRHTVARLYELMQASLDECGVAKTSFLGITDYDRKLVEALLRRKDWIDVVVPRGGDRLIQMVEETAVMPIIKNDRGLCHAYVADDADLEMSVRVVANAKTQRPGVCNSLETLLVHRQIADEFLPALYDATEFASLKWRCDKGSYAILDGRPRITLASDSDWNTEHLDQILNCRVVDSLEQAIEHIESHGSKHSETILTRDEKKARRFQAEVDSAAVYWNASTRFTDGFEFGLGGELGISTQKLHVRGPVGLRELTTPRWLIDGDGQIRA